MAEGAKLSVVTSYPAVVGVVLAAARKEAEKGISQKDMAEAIGATVSTWSRIETGETALTIEQLALAAEKLGVLPSQILKKADEAILELGKKGVAIEATRISSAAILAAGAVPLASVAVAGLVSPLGLAVGAAALGLHVYDRIKK